MVLWRRGMPRSREIHLAMKNTSPFYHSLGCSKYLTEEWPCNCQADPSRRLPEDLDQGIRGLVVALNEAGFETTDSGDGVSKSGEDVIPFPHVAIVVSKERMAAEADRLRKWMADRRMLVNQQGIAGYWYIEASYDPFVEDAVIFIGNPS